MPATLGLKYLKTEDCSIQDKNYMSDWNFVKTSVKHAFDTFFDPIYTLYVDDSCHCNNG